MESASSDELARNLRRIRDTRGLTQDGLADAAGVSRSYVASLEGARITNPGVMPCYALASTLGVTIEALLGRSALIIVSVRAIRDGYDLSDAQRELEARLVLVGARPFESMTPAQMDSYVPASLIDRDELISAATLAVSNHFARSLEVPAEWAALSWYSAGVLAMALRAENSHRN